MATDRPELPPADPGTVLLVDDERAILEICQGFLRPLGCRVVAVEDADGALAVLAREPVDVVLTDYSMPGKSGIELLQAARASHPAVMRVLYTGMVDTRVAEEALNRAGAFRFLVKPFAADALRGVVSDALAYRRLEAENRRFRQDMERLVEAQGRDLAAAKAFVESVLHALPAGVVALNPDGRVSRVNPAAEAILGSPGDRLVGQLAPEAGVPCRRQPGERCGEGEPRCRNRQVEVAGDQGPRRTLLWSCEAVHLPSGEDAGCVAAFVDVTDQRELEAKVFHAKQEIEAVFDSITDPTFVVDRDLRIVRANRALARLLRKPFREIRGGTCRELLAGLGGDYRRSPLRQVFQTGQPAQDEFQDPRGALYRVHFFPIFKRGHVGSVVGRYQNVTAERALEHRLLQSEKMAGIGQLAAGVAHEINNPVGFILSNLNRMGEYAEAFARVEAAARELAAAATAGDQDPVAAWRAYQELCRQTDFGFLVQDAGAIVAECREGAERIRKIVLDLKTFSHSNNQEWEYADLNRGLESTINIAWNELKYRCEVVRDLGELPRVLCRPQQLNQVFLNLLINAAQAIPERGVVTVRTRAAGDRVTVAVTDSGTGIAPEHLGRIFEPFYTTKPVGKGTGLGLHLALGIVRSHQGEIRVESQPGMGSTFTVSLPVLPPGAGGTP